MICDEAVLKNLADAGCGEEWVARYRALSGTALSDTELSRRQERLLRVYRKALLDGIHEQQHRLDCLDYLLYQLREDVQGKTQGGKP